MGILKDSGISKTTKKIEPIFTETFLQSLWISCSFGADSYAWRPDIAQKSS